MRQWNNRQSFQKSSHYAIVDPERDSTFLDKENDLLDEYKQEEHIGRLDWNVGHIFDFLEVRFIWRKHVEHGSQDVPLFVQNLAVERSGDVHFLNYLKYLFCFSTGVQIIV